MQVSWNDDRCNALGTGASYDIFSGTISCTNTGQGQAGLTADLLKNFWKFIVDCKVNLSSWYCIKDKHYVQAHAEDCSLKGTLLSSQPSPWQPYCHLLHQVSKQVETEKTQKRAIRIIRLKKTQLLWNDWSDPCSFNLKTETPVHKRSPNMHKAEANIKGMISWVWRRGQYVTKCSNSRAFSG